MTTATKPCDHRFDKHGNCTCGAQQCGEAIAHGGGPCAQPRPCRAHGTEPLSLPAKLALIAVACLVIL